MSKKKTENNSHAIIIAVISALATIFAAIIGSQSTYKVEKLRQESELTRMALASPITKEVPTQTPAISALPIINTATSGYIPTPIFFADEFANGSATYWSVGSSENSYWKEQKSILNDSYRWEVTALQDVTACLLSNAPSVSDFELQVDLQIISGSNFMYGIYFRESDAGGYYFFLDDKGNYGLNLWNAKTGEVEHKIYWVTSSVINTKVSNTLKIMAQGNKILLYINENMVGDIIDDTLLSGQLGLAAALVKGQSVALDMRHFKLLVPPDQTYNK